MRRVMVDIEAFGNGAETACIVQIGACDFDGGAVSNPFKVNIDAQDAVRNGAVIDADTMYWWLTQSPEAQASVLAEPRLPEREAFAQLNAYLNGADEIWSHATYDFVLITGALRRLGMKPTFRFRGARDIRTLNALSGHVVDTKAGRMGTHHDALDDAIHQAHYVMRMLKALERKGATG